jgi:hypothetical protein
MSADIANTTTSMVRSGMTSGEFKMMRDKVIKRGIAISDIATAIATNALRALVRRVNLNATYAAPN